MALIRGFMSRLRDVRTAIAKREGCRPTWCFHNKTLEALARYRPTGSEDALAVPGIGEAKAAQLPAAVPGGDRRLGGGAEQGMGGR